MPSRILLGVAGGIAAYKACELLRGLTEAGHQVTVVPTAAACEFVGVTTWAALSGQPVQTGVFEGAEHVPHVSLGQRADLVIVAPATADLIARAAHGRADDLLTNVLLTARCPVLLAPAMHTEMWFHPATRANVTTLRSRGVVVLDPASGRLTGADTGPGRLPDPAEIQAIASSLLAAPALAQQVAGQDLTGLRFVISAGGTREYLDPVRYLGNASSGRMGISLARAARLRGASVRLVAAHLDAAPPAGVAVQEVVSTEELGTAMREAAADADVIIMAAAPADFTPSRYAGSKIKKSGSDSGLVLDLVQTSDILAGLAGHRTGDQVVVGFAAETPATDQELLELGQAKLKRKGCDLLVLNDVSSGQVFGSDQNTITVLGSGQHSGPHTGTKDVLSHHIVDQIQQLRHPR